MIDTFGRKLMSGDVIEVPNLTDYHPLDNTLVKSLPRYYVIQDANFASEGFSVTWLPHLWRIKATPMVNAQEYSQIINQPFMPENIWDNGNFYPSGTIVNYGNTYYQASQNVPAGTDITNTNYWTVINNPDTVGDKQTTRPKDLAINDAILTQAYEDVPLSGYDNVKFYILPTGPNGEPASTGLTADNTTNTVDGSDWRGYLTQWLWLCSRLFDWINSCAQWPTGHAWHTISAHTGLGRLLFETRLLSQSLVPLQRAGLVGHHGQCEDRLGLCHTGLDSACQLCEQHLHSAYHRHRQHTQPPESQ
jgi:hypothetical protein